MLEVQTYLDNGLPVLYAHLNQTKNGFTMADRFKDDKTKQDYTFYSMSKKTDKKINMTKFMYCIKCASEPIIAVDNAKEYICNKCIEKTLSEKWNIRSRK
tara:strand:- start:1606 stop:1905 length:300 start_codon:yes stop_codon:yes gene_type:complete